MKKKLVVITIIIFIGLFISFWSIVSGGYDRQNKYILMVKKIIHPHIARKVRDTIFIIPSLKNENQLLSLQVQKFEQKLNGNLFNEQNLTSTNNLYTANLKQFFLPFKRLDINLGWQANKNLKRAHYLELIDDKVLIMSGEGETIYFEQKNLNNKKLNQNKLKNNINSLLKEKNAELYAIRDLYYERNFVYTSIVEKNIEGFTLNIYRAPKNFNNLSFEIFFKTNEYSPKYSLQTGGRIEKFKDNKILLAIGFFGKHASAQDTNNLAGKIISIDKDSRDYDVLSYGHRNPQGLFYLNRENLIINSEHGPKGGDEVNLNFLNNNEIKNFGWPISSYGDPYPGTEKIFEKNGWLKKSHKENNFIEPLKYFKPSIGISEIIFKSNSSKDKNQIFVSSLRASSIYVIELDNKLKKVISTDRLYFDTNRIRDLKYDEKSESFLLIFENTPAIGLLSIK